MANGISPREIPIAPGAPRVSVPTIPQVTGSQASMPAAGRPPIPQPPGQPPGQGQYQDAILRQYRVMGERAEQMSDAERLQAATAMTQAGVPAPSLDLGTDPNLPTDFDAEAAQATEQVRQAGGEATAAEPELSRWEKFIDTIADPTSRENFLLTLGTQLLQPRPEIQGQTGFIAQGVSTATDRLAQSRAARAAAQLEARKTEAEIGKMGAETGKLGAETTEIQTDLTKVPSEIFKNNAAAYRDIMAGNKDAKGPAAAAQVQMLDRMTATLRELAPDLYPTDAAARLGAFGVMNPDSTRSDFIANYLANNFMFHNSEEEARAAAESLADSMGWTGGVTLGAVLTANQRAKESKRVAAIPTPTADSSAEDVNAYFRARYPDATDAQVQEAANQWMQQNATNPQLAPEADATVTEEAAPAPTSRTERREASATTAARTKEERQTRVAQKIRNLKQLSWEQAKTLYEQEKDILTAAQRKALLKKLGAKQTRRGVRIPLSDPNG